ncbi:MAG TPA: alcohol dehydrogenase catalytic domain-containing protein [Thermoanaerobaculia bacterium]|nr:alcohol dehydrogenase catalytic domain-containing protein [Thermoanaerobaculia bacterium]
MRALWLEDRRLAIRDDVERPVPPAGESLVRVLLAGICNTDLELTRGYYPFTGVPGHEFVGELEDGRRVAGEINASCGACEPCRNGRRTHCDRRTVLGIVNRHGAFAEYLTLPFANLHFVPPDVATGDAVFIEPLAAALEVQEQVRITPRDRVLVVGDGKLGQLIAMTLRLTGCELVVAGHHRHKLERLARLGIETVAGDAPAETPRQFDVAVECTGSPAGFELARKALRARGTLVMKSTYAGQLTVNASSLVVDEITLVGSRCGPFRRAIEVMETRSIDVRDLVEEVYPLGAALAAFEHAQRPGALKILLRP